MKDQPISAPVERGDASTVSAESFGLDAEMQPVVDELRRRMKSGQPGQEQHADRRALYQIGVMAMTAQSDPYSSAAVYRKALVDICNFALKAQDAEAALARLHADHPPATARLTALVEQWRKQLDEHDGGSNKLSADEAGQLSTCADELEAALSRLTEP